MTMNSAELREKYLAFFESKGCQRWPSGSLVPDDPSLLLTSAGMVQFKPYFLQQRQLEAPFIGTTTVQKCVRTTDIDVIGTDWRHLSFFEMLGNFSFGDYFKQEMCEWALEFSTEVLGFALDKLHFSVYEDDEETIEIWKSLGVPESRIYRLGADDNFWRAGPTGPCGPCSELYYDQGEEYGCGSPDCAPGCDCDRYMEYWNCVFTQYDGQEDGSLVPLPKKNIDTGMGLERTITLLNGINSVFNTDILRRLIAVSEQLSGCAYGQDEQADLAMRIIADHSRSCTFMIGDGVLPSNEGRGYVLRRLLRRAMRYGHLLGIEPPFLTNMVQVIVEEMGGVYPEIKENQALIERVCIAEEERFAQTLRQGQNYLDAQLAALNSGGELPGQAAFELHDRYGFPIDLTIEIAAEGGYSVDRAGFDQHMQQQRQRAREALKDAAWSAGDVYQQLAASLGATEFCGYESDSLQARVLALVVEGEGGAELAQYVEAGQSAQVILNKTPFYAEMGGQVGDSGSLLAGESVAFQVADTQAHELIHIHIGVAAQRLAVGDILTAAIDKERRQRIERNHTATHLLHYALRQVVGEHVKQAGSLVAPDRLRFDFTHFEPLTESQIDAVEDMVNRLIMEDGRVSAETTSLDAARAAGVIALFGEKYGADVRVLTTSEVSQELCGGTHVEHTAQIGLMKIVSEGSVGSSLRRIEAVTSLDALDFIKRQEQQLHSAAALLKTRPADLTERIEALLAHQHELESALRAERRSALATSAEELLLGRLADAPIVAVVKRLDGLDADAMRSLWDQLRAALAADLEFDGAALMVLGGVAPGGAPLLLAAATDVAVDKGYDANSLIKQIAALIGGGGGGRKTLAQAGGKDADGLDAALALAADLLLAR